MSKVQNAEAHKIIIDEMQRNWTLPVEMSAERAREQFPEYFAAFGPPNPKRALHRDATTKTVWQSVYDFDPTGVYVHASFAEVERAAKEQPKRNSTMSVACAYTNSLHFSKAECRTLILVTGALPIHGLRRDDQDISNPAAGQKSTFQLTIKVDRSDTASEDEVLLRDKFAMFDTHIIAHLKAVNVANKSIRPVDIEAKYNTLAKPPNSGSTYWMKFKVDQFPENPLAGSPAHASPFEFKDLGLFRFSGTAEEWEQTVGRPKYLAGHYRPYQQDQEKWEVVYRPDTAKPPGQWESNGDLIGRHAQGGLHFTLPFIMKTTAGFYPRRTVMRVFFRCDDGHTKSMSEAEFSSLPPATASSSVQPVDADILAHIGVAAPPAAGKKRKEPEPEPEPDTVEPEPQPVAVAEPPVTAAAAAAAAAPEKEKEKEKEKNLPAAPPAVKKVKTSPPVPAAAAAAAALPGKTGPPKLNLPNLAAALPKK